jgi:hypothetical protein
VALANGARSSFCGRRRACATVVAAVLSLWALPVSAKVAIEAGGPGVAVENGTNLLIALPIENSGDRTAFDVKLFDIDLRGGNLISPRLPLDLGTIAPGENSVVQLRFQVFGLNRSPSFELTVDGRYRDGDERRHDDNRDDRARHDRDRDDIFRLATPIVIPPPAPGSAPLHTGAVVANHVSGAPFPPQPPSFSREVNGSRWSVPTGSFVPGIPTPSGTSAQKAPLGDPNTVTFNANNGFKVNDNPPTEPSGATGGGVVFATANFIGAYSTDGGSTFTQLNPTTIFPNDAVGFCCDQIVQYVPSIDRFIWLLQGAAENGVRLASASPADVISSKGTAWTYWNLTPDVFGQPNGTGFDYPDLSVGTNYLYLSWDNGWPNCPSGCSSGREVARVALGEIKAGGTIEIDYTNPSDSPMAWGDHLSQDTGDEIFWAGHNSNKNMRVFSLAENSGTYFWRDIGISTWANNKLSSTTPDGQDWLAFLSGFPGNAVIGATRAPGPPSPGSDELFSDGLWFAWSAGTDSNFAQPHVEMVTLDRSNNFAVVQQVQIWNSGYGFAYPALATNACTGEIGLSLEYGGNGNYQNHVVGFWGDFLVYITTNSNLGTTRFGDYVTIRQDPSPGLNGSFFDAFGYGLDTVPPPGTGSQSDIRYVVFGRGGACSHGQIR